MCPQRETNTQKKTEAVMTHLPYQCAEVPQALPRWHMSRDHGPTPVFGARAFALCFGGAGRETAGKLMHAWVAQEDKEEGVSGTKVALVRIQSISQGAVGELVLWWSFPTSSALSDFAVVCGKPLCRSVSGGWAWLSHQICNDL